MHWGGGWVVTTADRWRVNFFVFVACGDVLFRVGFRSWIVSLLLSNRCFLTWVSPFPDVLYDIDLSPGGGMHPRGPSVFPLCLFTPCCCVDTPAELLGFLLGGGSMGHPAVGQLAVPSPCFEYDHCLGCHPPN
jgi:hypothetical protein